ncbi:hypothetical protein MUK42_03221 [Musa troglodytarum]|uniref:Ferredoxin-thioredoxin reductase catalytic chain, chloroplastic n=1 Tax=Musa troglodytarum TaxID=320322 RepID=A0A9E7L8Y9_9LILI|nr:hypothetical protein MUK42_03221 [Musa troglodytarum]
MSIQTAFHGVALPSLTPASSSPHRPRRLMIRAEVEPSDKSVEVMRKFSEQYARRSGTYFCVDKGVTAVVIKCMPHDLDSSTILGCLLLQWSQQFFVGLTHVEINCKECKHFVELRRTINLHRGLLIIETQWGHLYVLVGADREEEEWEMSARPHVTITLGRSGQFVKRARPGADFGQSDHDVSSGRHQPTRERSGSDMTDSSLYGSQHKNKRIRTENNNSSSDRRIGRNDLRFKLINKSLFRKTDTGGGGQNDVDLREKLSRNREISFKSNPRRNLGEFRTSGTVRRLPPMRSADDLLQLDSKRKSYSSRTVDERRHRSPDKLNSNARAFYSPRSHKDLPHALSMRPIDASRHSSFIKNGLVNSSRTISSLGKTGLPIDAGKSVVRDSSSGSIMHRSTHKRRGRGGREDEEVEGRIGDAAMAEEMGCQWQRRMRRTSIPVNRA